MSRDLDKEYPMGEPLSPHCRWCGKAKRVHNDAVLVCTECDGLKPKGVVE